MSTTQKQTSDNDISNTFAHPFPPLKRAVIPRSDAWYWGWNAGRERHDFGPKHLFGREIRELPLKYVLWCLKTFNHPSTPPAQKSFRACAQRYYTGLQENVDSLCSYFAIPFKRDGARTLDECNDKEYMKWMLQTDGLPGSEPLFCQAVKAWLDKEDKRGASIIANRRARRATNDGVKREENEEETLVNNQEGSPDLINAFGRAQRTTASSSRAVLDISNRTLTKRYRNAGVSAGDEVKVLAEYELPYSLHFKNIW
ncbi:hypothetical protein M422DRAFT_776339 [Sphaerobolus stellatus SS14]|nr:hypothetical protein M422DRAFT_776339 [Sphaerobolus stellatus SS14]